MHLHLFTPYMTGKHSNTIMHFLIIVYMYDVVQFHFFCTYNKIVLR
jgi:hypothetical protein